MHFFRSRMHDMRNSRNDPIAINMLEYDCIFSLTNNKVMKFSL